MADELPLSHSPAPAQRSPLRLAAGFALLTPALVCCVAQLAFPTFQTFVNSFRKIDLLSPPVFVGLENYSALSGNRAFASALGFTLMATVVRVLAVTLVPLMLALGVSALGRAGRLTLRVLFTLPLAFFMPVTIALAWQVLFAGQRLPILNTPAGATTTLLLIDSIYTLGLACGLGLIFFLAALRGGGHGRSWTPLLVAWGGGIAGTIALSLQSFTLSFLLTRGGPANATATLMLDYYQMAFQNFRIGPASALGVLLLIGLAVPGVLVGAAVVFTRLRLTTTAEADQAPEPLLGKPLGIVSLVVALLLALPACALSVAPIPAIVTASLTDDAYGRFIESIPFGNVTMNTVLPVLLSALIQTLITYLGALGIGGLRPLGRRSELLLLLFSPWLFVSLRPLSAAIFQGMAAARNFNSFFALIPPIWLNVPMLFILTLFFKGQAPRRETASSTSSLILPSLPLTALLFCAALWVGGQDLWWPLIAGRGPQFYTAQTALTFVAAQFFTASGPMAAGLVLFSLPSFLFFFLVFSLFQVFYLERLRLEAGEDEAATPADQADDASTRLAMSAQCDVVIVGAGPGGAAAAHTLARGGLKVRLFDKAEFPRDKTCGDGLTPRALNVLDDMGLLIRLLRLGWRINTAAVVAPDGGRVAVEFPKKEDVPNYALVVPRLTLDNVLLEGAIASGAQFQGSTHVTGIASDGEGVTLTGETRGRSFSAHARLGIIATGASTKLLRQIGILKRQPETVLAARAYFEGLDGLTDCFEFRFDHLSLPGYGWLFPISEAAANVGVGLWPTSRSRRPDARSGLDSFIQNPRLQEMMAKARRAGPVKSYPIRTDFASAPVVGEKLLLVGEAAGLVNPITGEGIDYALESGQMAASHVLGMFEAGDLSQGRLETYDRLLRGRYQRLFVYCDLIRRFTFNILTLNLLVRLAARRPDLKHLLAKILLQVEDPPAISAASLLKAGWVLSRRA